MYGFFLSLTSQDRSNLFKNYLGRCFLLPNCTELIVGQIQILKSTSKRDIILHFGMATFCHNKCSS